MGKRATNIILETEQELKVLLKKATVKIVRRRLETALLLKSNPHLTRNQVAALMGVNKRSIERWVVLYQQGGIQSFLTVQPKSPKKSVVTPELHLALAAKLKDESRAFRGYFDAQRWILEEFYLYVNYQTLRSYMIRHFGKRLKVSRKILFIKDKHFRDVPEEKGEI